jgi:enoyl-CoA hydratase/carnithine racemase
VAADLGVDLEAEALGLVDRVVEARGLAGPAVGERGLAFRVGVALDLAGVERESADLVAQAAARRGLARGPQLAVTAARHLFPVSLPVSLAEDLPGAVNQPKKSFLEFSVH